MRTQEQGVDERYEGKDGRNWMKNEKNDEGVEKSREERRINAN